MKKKKFFYVMLSFFSLIALASCGNNSENNTSGVIGNTLSEEEINKALESEYYDEQVFTVYTLMSYTSSRNVGYEEWVTEITDNEISKDKTISCIKKTSTKGKEDVYTIFFSDGDTKEFSLSNNDKFITGNGIYSIEKVTEDSENEYFKFVYTDGTEYEYSIKKNSNVRIELGNNGHWYIDDLDTKIKTFVNKERYTVSFDTGDSSIGLSDKLVKANQTVSKPINPKRAGYKLDYWYSETLKRKWDFKNDKVTEDITLKAVWIKSDDEEVVYTKGLSYSLDTATDTYTVTGLGTATDTDIIVPSTYNGKMVTKIGDRAFYRVNVDAEVKKVKAITLPDTIEYIGEEAFYNCSYLKTITIPKNVTYISNTALYFCRELIEIINLSSINIDNDYFILGDSLSTDILDIKTSGKSEIYVMDNDYLFYTYKNKDYLLGYIGTDTELELPLTSKNGTYNIYRRAFYKRLDITKIDIPDTVTGFGGSSFNGPKLESVNIPYGVTIIPAKCFNGTDIREANIPETVNYIGSIAFNGCKYLKYVNLPEKLTYLAPDAFQGCSLSTLINLSSINLDEYMISTKKIIKSYDEKNEFLESDFVFDTSDDETTYLVDYRGNDKNVVLPDSYNGKKYSIDSYAFSSKQIETIKISNGVEFVSNYAFAKCDNLLSIDVSENVECLPTIYTNSKRLKEIVYSSNKEIDTIIGNFYYSKDKSNIVIENDYKYISDGQTATLLEYVGNDSIIELPKTLGGLSYDIGSYAFAYNTNLLEVTIPEGIYQIPYFAFYKCYNLSKITIPSTVQYIETGALRHTGLEMLEFNSDISIMGSFGQCFYLTSVTFNGNASLYNNTFDECVSLSSVTFNGSLVIYGTVFKRCTSLTEITLPKDVIISNKNSADIFTELLKTIKYDGTKEEFDAIDKDCWGIDLSMYEIIYLK